MFKQHTICCLLCICLLVYLYLKLLSTVHEAWFHYFSCEIVVFHALF